MLEGGQAAGGRGGGFLDGRPTRAWLREGDWLSHCVPRTTGSQHPGEVGQRVAWGNVHGDRVPCSGQGRVRGGSREGGTCKKLREKKER